MIKYNKIITNLAGVVALVCGVEGVDDGVGQRALHPALALVDVKSGHGDVHHK